MEGRCDIVETGLTGQWNVDSQSSTMYLKIVHITLLVFECNIVCTYRINRLRDPLSAKQTSTGRSSVSSIGRFPFFHFHSFSNSIWFHQVDWIKYEFITLRHFRTLKHWPISRFYISRLWVHQVNSIKYSLVRLCGDVIRPRRCHARAGLTSSQVSRDVTPQAPPPPPANVGMLVTLTMSECVRCVGVWVCGCVHCRC